MRMKKLSLEEYCAFHRNPQNHGVLTIGQLNQVIVMHGFNRLHNRPKKELADRVLSIGALVPPTRSTLHENISACARLTVGEVENDLAELGWQECPVRSIKTLKSTNPNDAVGAGDDVHRICDSSTLDPGSLQPLIVGPAAAAKGKRSKSKKRKHRDLQNVVDANPPAAATATIDILAEVAATAAAAFDGDVALLVPPEGERKA